MPSLRLVSTPHYTSHILRAVALCFLLAAAPACARAYGKDYFPLSDGACWEYAACISLANGKEFHIRAPVHVDVETLIGGKKYFKFVLSSDMSGLPAERRLQGVRYYRYGKDGLYVRCGNAPDEADRLEI